MSVLVELPEEEYSATAFADFAPATGFSIGTARAMAWMSQLAYETRWPDKIARVGRMWGLDSVRPLEVPVESILPLSDTRGILATGGGAAIIAFAGTDPLSLRNWISNLYLGRPSADVHEGFQAAAAVAWADVGTVIEQCVADDRPLFIAGHSLGAAIAIVTADRACSEKNLRRAEVHLFGAPRAGKAEFVDRYNSSLGATTYRFVHGEDIVPTVPPVEWGFHHVGRFLQCERGGRFDPARLLDRVDSDEPSPGDDFVSGIALRVRDLFAGPLSPTSRNDALGRLSQLLAPSIADHLPDRYCHALAP